VIKLEEVRPPGLRTLDEVREQIRGVLRFPQISEEQRKIATEFHDKVAGGADFRQTAEAMKLSVQDGGVATRQGTLPGLGPAPALIQAIFSTDKGKVTAVVPVGQSQAVALVDDLVPNYKPPLDAIRPRVLQAYKADHARDAALEKARTALAATSDMAQLAKTLGVELKKTEPALIRGQALPGIGVDRTLEQAAFDASAGATVGPVAGDRAVAVLHVTGREEADVSNLAGEAEAIRESLRAARANWLVQKRVEELQTGAEIKRNPALTARRNT
jgi:parvulin-like peptidyl-prolyl isomerase